MALTTRIILRGDKLAADRLRLRHGVRLMEEFRRLTGFQKLQQNERLVRFDDGSEIHMATRFGHEQVVCYAPTAKAIPLRQLPGTIAHHLWIPAYTADPLAGGLRCVAAGVGAFTNGFEWHDSRYLGPDGYQQPGMAAAEYLGAMPTVNDGFQQDVLLEDVPPYTAASGYIDYIDTTYAYPVTQEDTLSVWEESGVYYGAWTAQTDKTVTLYRKNIATDEITLIHGPLVGSSTLNITKAQWSLSSHPALGGGSWTTISGTSAGGFYDFEYVGVSNPGQVQHSTAEEDTTVFGAIFGVRRSSGTFSLPITDPHPLYQHEAWLYANVQGQSYEIATSIAQEVSDSYEGYACLAGEQTTALKLFAPVDNRSQPFMLYRVPYANRLGEVWYGVADIQNNNLLKLPSSGVMDVSLDLATQLRVVKRTVSDGRDLNHG